MSAAMFPCFGIAAFGMCAYNPLQPANTYFNLGDGVAALTFTLAVQQLLKPIYVFRLRAYGIRVAYAVAAVFFGVFCSIVAMLIPSLGISVSSPLGYPVFWELLGGAIIFVTYGLVAVIFLTPARIFRWNLISYVRAGGALLAGADENDRASFGEDILHEGNIAALIRHARVIEIAESHAVFMEFERRRTLGMELSVTGQPPLSAFYLFAHRRELTQASFAATFLRIISDAEFCAVLVRRHPWRIASILQFLADTHLHTRDANDFVQQIAAQAILQEDSLLSKEVGFGGFANASLLSDALFENYFILRTYSPLGGLRFHIPEYPSNGFCERLNTASKMMLKTALENDDYWPVNYMDTVEFSYERLSLRASWARHKKEEFEPSRIFHNGIDELTRMLMEAFPSLDWQRQKGLFKTRFDQERYPIDLVNLITRMVYKCIEEAAVDFNGYKDMAWPYLISLFMHIYPIHTDDEEGMTPLQQQLAGKLLKDVEQNMQGLWHPPTTRVLLALVGPYSRPPRNERTPYGLLRDAFYLQLKKLERLSDDHPDVLVKLLPNYVTYNRRSNTLEHVYAGGEIAVTSLSEINVPEINLCNEINWRRPLMNLR